MPEGCQSVPISKIVLSIWLNLPYESNYRIFSVPRWLSNQSMLTQMRPSVRVKHRSMKDTAFPLCGIEDTSSLFPKREEISLYTEIESMIWSTQSHIPSPSREGKLMTSATRSNAGETGLFTYRYLYLQNLQCSWVDIDENRTDTIHYSHVILVVQITSWMRDLRFFWFVFQRRHTDGHWK